MKAEEPAMVSTFLQESCVREKGASVSVSDLYQSFMEWAAHPEIPQEQFDALVRWHYGRHIPQKVLIDPNEAVAAWAGLRLI